MCQPETIHYCPFCETALTVADLAESAWQPASLTSHLPLCPPCARRLLLAHLTVEVTERHDEHRPRAWNCLPLHLRVLSDPRFTGVGQTIAFVDSGFYPHPDLTVPRNRIRAWVDVGKSRLQVRTFGPHDHPTWPGWDSTAAHLWHGQMTSCVGAGSGGLSGGLYRSLAPDADVVLIQARDERGRIPNATITRALRWLHRHGASLGVSVVNLSVGGDPVQPVAGNAVDEACMKLVEQGVVVVAAAGNHGRRHLLPPATCPAVITVGGLNDGDSPARHVWKPWHSDYGKSSDGEPKPELIAPSLRVVAPILPGSSVEAEAHDLFLGRAARQHSVDHRIEVEKLVTPYYQHMEGTSVAAPIVSATIACMLQANPKLTPRRVRELLLACGRRVPGLSEKRQGAGGLFAGRAVALALADRFHLSTSEVRPPRVLPRKVAFQLLAPRAHSVTVVCTWTQHGELAVPLRQAAPGLWRGEVPRPRAGRYRYHYLIDHRRRLADPVNPAVSADGLGGWDSVLTVPRRDRSRA